MQEDLTPQQWDYPDPTQPGPLVHQPSDWHSSFQQLRSQTQAQPLQLRPHQPPAYPVPQPPAAPVYHAPSYGPPSYEPPSYQAPQYQAPSYGQYAPVFKPTIVVHTTATSSQDNDHGGRWVFLVLAWFLLVPVLLVAGGE